MAKLPETFPHFAVLDTSGEATHAKIRKRIADGTLKEIPGIADAKAEEIEKAFAKIDTPADQADEQRTAEDDNKGKPTDTRDEGAKRERLAAEKEADAEFAEAGATPTTHVNQGTHAADVRSRSDAENRKSGVVVNREMANHALDKPAGASTASGTMSDGERLANCGAVYVDHPTTTPFASKTAVKFEQKDGRIPQLAISSVSPRTGMEVRDGEDVYALAEGFGRDTQPIDWLRVRSPNTGKPFIE